MENLIITGSAAARTSRWLRLKQSLIFLRERKTKISSISLHPKRTAWEETITMISEIRLYFPDGL